MGDGGGERDGDLGGGEGVVGGDGNLGGGDCYVEDCGEGDLGGGDLCLFCQVRRVVGESGGGIGIAGEPTHCGGGIWGEGIFAYFAKQGELWERVEGELVLQGNLHVVSVSVFFS